MTVFLFLSLASIKFSTHFVLFPPYLSSLTLSAYQRVFRVVSEDLTDGATFPIIKVWQFPINDSLRTIVSLEPQKGRCCLAESKALIHSLRASKDLLISAPSYLVWVLLVLTSLPRSFPARSINEIWPCFFQLSMFLSMTYKMACDLEELSFMPVLPTTLFERPNDISSKKES